MVNLLFFPHIERNGDGMCTNICMYIHVQVKVEPITVPINVCIYVRNRFLLLIMLSSVVVPIIDDKNDAFYITLFVSEIAYK
jgi:hypothetical protein